MPSHIRSFRNVLNRFRRNRRGSTVVEFALVAPMFFALLFAIIETALHVLCQPGARDRGAGFRAADHDRSGAEREPITAGAVQDRRLQPASP